VHSHASPVLNLWWSPAESDKAVVGDVVGAAFSAACPSGRWRADHPLQVRASCANTGSVWMALRPHTGKKITDASAARKVGPRHNLSLHDTAARTKDKKLERPALRLVRSHVIILRELEIVGALGDVRGSCVGVRPVEQGAQQSSKKSHSGLQPVKNAVFFPGERKGQQLHGAADLFSIHLDSRRRRSLSAQGTTGEH